MIKQCITAQRESITPQNILIYDSWARLGPRTRAGPRARAWPMKVYISTFCGVIDPLCGVIHCFITPGKQYFPVLSYVVYHPILWSDRSLLWAGEMTLPRGPARARGPSLAHEGYINIFCGVIDPLCGVIHCFITPQKLYFPVLLTLCCPSPRFVE